MVRPIGTGGMAAVYEVRDVLTREHHALKILEDADGRQLFDREYEVMNRLNNPGIVRTYRYGLHDDMPWMSMELLYGIPAQTFVKQLGPPGTEERTQQVIRIGALTARALHYVHGNGIIHRDIKGSNVLLLPDRRVKLVDFGIAYLSDAMDRTVQGGNFIGTPGYASPEQILGGKLGPRSDLYGLAVLLFRLLTGRTPFQDKDLGDLLRSHLKAPRPHPNQILPSLPKRVSSLIVQMMDIDPGERPRHAGAVADQLDAMIGATILPSSSLAIHTPVADGRERIRRTVMRRRKEHPMILLVGNDERDRLRILETLVEEARQDQRMAHAATATGSTARLMLAEALARGIRESFEEDPLGEDADLTALSGTDFSAHFERAHAQGAKGFFFAVQMGDLDPDALQLAVELATSPAGRSALVNLVVGCSEGAAQSPHAAPALDARAALVPIPPLTAHESSLAVGRMLGRRPPAGTLAQQIFDVTAGWPTAVEDVVHDLVEAGQVSAEGDQLLWSRQMLDIPVPAKLRSVLSESMSRCTPREQHILHAVALMHGATYQALDAHIPHSEGILEQVLDSLTERGLLCLEGGLFKPGTRTLGVMLRDELRGSRRKALRKLLSRDPNSLSPSFFRVQALLAAGRLHDALDEVLSLAEGMVATGRWKEASVMLEEVYNEASSFTVTSELAELLLLYARCGLATGRRDIATAQALSVVRRFVKNDTILTECDLMEAELQRSIGHYANYRNRVSQGVERASSIEAPTIRARLSYSLGQGHLWLGNLYEAEKALTNAKDILNDVQSPLLSRILASQAKCAYSRGDLSRADEQAEAALAIAHEDPVAISSGLRVWADKRRREGRYSEALSVLRGAAVKMRTYEDPRPYTQILVGIAECECDLHRLGLAQECLDELASVIREGELLHIRLQRTILEGRVRILSGQARNAEFLLGSAENSAKNAELALLASQARTYRIRAQHLNGTLQDPLDDWLESRRIDFLANRHLWSFVDACIVYLQVAPPTTDPEALLQPITEAIRGENMLPLRVEIQLALARHLQAMGKKRESLIACREATKLMAQMSKELEDTERSAMRVHPWPRQVQEILKSQ